MDICIQLCLCTYELPRLLSLLVLACIASKDERDIPSKLEGFTYKHFRLIGEVKGSLFMAAWNDSGRLISVISFGIVFQMRMARG